MMFVLKVGDDEVVLNADQFDALTSILSEASVLKNEWVGKGKGDDGDSYVRIVRAYATEKLLRPFVMTDDTYGALEFKTKLFDEAKSQE